MSGTIDSAVERERDEKSAKGAKSDARKGPGKTGPAEETLPDDDGEAIKPNQSRSTPMAGQNPETD